MSETGLADIRGPQLRDVPVLRDCGPLTLGGFLLEVCRRYAGNEAVVFDDPLRGGETVRWTYADLERESRRVARALLACDVGKGSRVATLMSNRPEALAAYFGAAMAGAVVVPLSTFSPRPELAQLLRDSDAAVLLTQTTMGDQRFCDDVRALVDAAEQPLHSPGYPHLRRIVAVGPVDDRAGLPAWDELLTAGEQVPAELVDATTAATEPADLGLVIYSSGTTSTPKGVLHNHRSPTLQFWLQAELFGRHERTRMWTALPLFWTAGMNSAIGSTLAAGGCCVLQEGFDAGAALQLMARERVTEPYTLPHQAKAIEAHPDWAATDLSALRCVYGKSVFTRHPKVAGDPDWRMPAGWGMSETCAFISAHPSTESLEVMKASLGTLLPGMQLKVADPDTGATLALGQDGELLVRGIMLFERYIGKTREECFDADGWFHTGDVGYVDERGEVHWTGRRTEMIKTGGANVSPAEIEVQLRAHPDVKLARVIAMPDDRLDQVPVLCLELVPGAQPDAHAIRSFLRERLAAYKVPKQVLFFAPGQIPMNASGTKVVDDALRVVVENRIAAADDSTGAP